jgi:hypothetical protein
MKAVIYKLMDIEQEADMPASCSISTSTDRDTPYPDTIAR